LIINRHESRAPTTARRGPLAGLRGGGAAASFRAAGEELHLTQPAISRQIRSLEDEIGATLFLRGTRHVELTSAGAALLRAVAPWLDRLDASVRQIRSQSARQRITVTTFASFASLWLIPRLQDFQRLHPEVDIRVSATDAMADPDDPEIDFALRYAHADQVPADVACRCSTRC
jgi:LysR family glycine cleavage system transcriptional activator